MSPRMMAGAIALTCAVGASACGGGDELHPKLFSTDWQDDQGKSIAAVQARLRSAKPPASTDVVIAVAGAKADKILGLPLGGGTAWTFPHPLDARPVIAGTLVVGTGGGELFALDAQTGKRLWARPIGDAVLTGAGDDGTTTVAVIAKGAGSVMMFVSRDGKVPNQIQSDKQLGDPAAIGGIAFVPWQNQYVSAIDIASAEEIGRVVVRDKVSQALTIGGGLYFGELGFIRFDDKIGMASRGGASRVGIPSRELPGSPRVLVPGSEKQRAIANARDRDRLFARPTPPDTAIGLDSSRFYAAYYRLVIGFESSKGQLMWVHTHPVDVIGGGAVIGGLVLCDEQGKISVLDARTGGVAMDTTFGEPIRSCVVHADTYRSPPNQQAAGQSLADQIATAVLNREATLATAQRLLLRELATLEDESATKTLVEIASDPRSAPVLLADARTALAARRNGAQYMLSALAKHYDFLRDVLLPPPVGPIADALAAMKEPKAAGLVASHLMDPADTDDDIKRAAAALAVLGTKDELATLRQFFAAYRGTAETDEVALAVASVGEALLRIDPKDGRATVDAAIHDPMTVPVAKARLEALLAAAPAAAEAPKAPEKK